MHLPSTTRRKLIWFMWRSGGGMRQRLTFIHCTHGLPDHRFVFLTLILFWEDSFCAFPQPPCEGPVRKMTGGHQTAVPSNSVRFDFMALLTLCCRKKSQIYSAHTGKKKVFYLSPSDNYWRCVFCCLTHLYFTTSFTGSLVQSSSLMHALKEGMRSFMWADWKSSKETE